MSASKRNNHWRRVARSLPLAAALATLPAFACGPDFPPELLSDRNATMLGLADGTFDFEASRLVPKPAFAFKPSENPWDAPGAARIELETKEFGASGHEKIEMMRVAVNDAGAWAAGDGLPDDVRHYVAGARAFHSGEYDVAERRFRAVLALPDVERARRGIWAQYMLGRLERAAVGGAGLSKDASVQRAASAAQTFQALRSAVAAGAPDPLGLAVASYGEEAAVHLDQGDVAAAVPLYAQQAALGSASGRASLLFVARDLFANDAKLAQALGNPVLQPLLAAYVYTRSDEFGTEFRAPTSALERYYAAVEAADPATFAGGDRVAAAAYRAGRFDLAGKLAQRSEAPLALWVRAKLALRGGDVKAAADAYAQASRAFPREENWDDSEYTFPFRPGCRIDGERAVLALNRGDYVEALRLLHGAGDYWADTAYVAERVLTLDELKTFVDAEVPEPATEPKPDEYGYVASPPNRLLRQVLGRRLMRDGRYVEAVSYFRPDLRDAATRYANARVEAGKRSGIERAEQLFAAAVLARRSGMELLGAELAPDGAIYGGAYEWPTVDFAAQKGAFVTDAETARYSANAIVPEVRYHYRRVAADLANQAADLVPARSQAFAAMLCSATGWLINRDYDIARGYYLRYVRQGAFVPWAGNFGHDCPAPDFTGAAKRERAEQIAWAKKQARKAAPWAALVMLAAGIAIVVWRRRRRAVV